ARPRRERTRTVPRRRAAHGRRRSGGRPGGPGARGAGASGGRGPRAAGGPAGGALATAAVRLPGGPPGTIPAGGRAGSAAPPAPAALRRRGARHRLPRLAGVPVRQRGAAGPRGPAGPRRRGRRRGALEDRALREAFTASEWADRSPIAV